MALSRYQRDPLSFLSRFLGERPDAQQSAVLRALPRCGRLAIRSGNGCGKTWLATRAGLWFLLTRPHARVLVTAPTWRQVERVFFAELHGALRRFRLRHLLEVQRTLIRVKRAGRPAPDWFLMGLSSDAPENFQGFHARHLLFVLDEASGIPDSVFEAMEGNRATGEARMLVLGNPLRTSGRFYEIFAHALPGWCRFHFSCLRSRWVSRAWIEEKRAEWGEDSDLYRIRVLGEFPGGTGTAILRTPLPPGDPPSGALYGGLDVARFGDRSALCLLRTDGVRYHVEALLVWRGLPLPRLAEEVRRACSEVRALAVDAGGVGAGMLDLLEDLPVRGVYFGGKAEEFLDPEGQFANRKSALLAFLQRLLRRGLLTHSLPEERRRELEADLRGYRWLWEARLRAQDPVRSPDLGDALLLALYAERTGFPRILWLGGEEDVETTMAGPESSAGTGP